jgi:hypothetical protein
MGIVCGPPGIPRAALLRLRIPAARQLVNPLTFLYAIVALCSTGSYLVYGLVWLWDISVPAW